MNINPVQDIQSLSAFKRDTQGFMKRLKQTRSPLVLTVNGKAEVVVQDAGEYQKFLELTEFAEAIYGIQKGLDSMKNKQGMDASKFFTSFAKRNKITKHEKVQSSY